MRVQGRYWAYGRDHLAHHGIEGQKWGVRRYQNEDGTLTEEGKARYYKHYQEAEEKAEEDIQRAQSQLADIAENGWNARSAFSKKFVNQLADSVGGYKNLTDDDLKQWASIFEEDLAKARADKEAARRGREFLEKNQNVTYDQILNESEKIDKKDAKLNFGQENKHREAAAAIGEKLGLVSKNQPAKGTTQIKLPGFDKKVEKELKALYSKSDMEYMIKEFNKQAKKEAGADLGSVKIDGTSINELPIEQQFYIMLSLIDEFS